MSKQTMKERTSELMNSVMQSICNAENVVSFLDNIFKYPNNLPCRKWSYGNQFILHIQGCADARGFKQWQSVGRYVKKNSNSIYILAPQTYKKKTINDEGEEETLSHVYFKPVPVFDVADTDGKELDYREQLNSLDPLSLPLIDLAENMGLGVSYDLSKIGEGGYFNNKHQKIVLCCEDSFVFFHELAHAIDARLCENFSTCPTEEKEVVAEFVAAYLSSVYFNSPRFGEARTYIESYCRGKSIVKIMNSVFERCLNIIKYIDSYQVTHTI